eukprot:1795361-Pleurochrysis_carterae.AAC.1
METQSKLMETQSKLMETQSKLMETQSKLMETQSKHVRPAGKKALLQLEKCQTRERVTNERQENRYHGTWACVRAC